MLLARMRDGAYVLDNRTDRLVPWDGEGREYLPLGRMWLPRDYVPWVTRDTQHPTGLKLVRTPAHESQIDHFPALFLEGDPVF